MFEVLDAQNPWWRGKEKFEEDEDYRRWQSRGKRWVPALVDRLKLEPSSLYFLFGPRQVGKTTTVKFLVKRLLEEGVEPERIFYFRCDRVSDYKELDEVLSTYLRLRETRGIKGCFLFLDEITMPREWFRTIKFLIDTGKLGGDTLLLTGSMGMRARRETESFPGRRGKGRDLFLFPLSFRSFLKVADPELFEKLPPLAELEAEEIKKKCSLCLPLLDRLNSLFEVYTKCGG
ncbi:MAG: ATP-binding protein, partial [Candidatus Hadarchaeales archaeon]